MDFTVKTQSKSTIGHLPKPIVRRMNVWSSANRRLILDYHLKYAGIYLHVMLAPATPTNHPTRVFITGHKALRECFI